MLERLDSEEATFRVHVTGQVLRCKVISVSQVKARLNGEPTQKHPVHLRQLDAAVSILRAANYVDRSCSPVFDQHCITSQQFNGLCILSGAGMEGLPTLA